MNSDGKDILFWVIEGMLALVYPHEQPRDIRIENGHKIAVLLGDDSEFETDFEHLVDELRSIGNDIKAWKEEKNG